MPPHLEDAVLTALEKLPADRFATAAEFAAALANSSFATHGAHSTHTTSAAARALGWRAAAVIGAVALLLGAAGAKLLWPSRTEAKSTTRLMLEFPVRQQPRLASSGLPMLAQLPNGSGMLYSGPGANTTTQLWIRRWNRLDGTRLNQTIEDGCCASFSPNGDSVAYLASPHSLHVVSISGSLSNVVADSGLTAVSDFGGGVDWGSDGKLYVSGLAGLLRVSPQGASRKLSPPSIRHAVTCATSGLRHCRALAARSSR